VTGWALADRLVPILLVIAAYLAGFRLGRTWQRLQEFLDQADRENGDLL
jgi:hypothetical protein